MSMHFNENNQTGKGALAKTSFTKSQNISANLLELNMIILYIETHQKGSF